MATAANKNATLSAFVDQAKYWFDYAYPNWQNIFNSLPNQGMETICIPDALDVLSSRRFDTEKSVIEEVRKNAVNMTPAALEKELKKKLDEYKRDMTGQDGEDKFFEAFRQLRLGGILISNFMTQEFVKKMRVENVSDFDYSEWETEEGKPTKSHFECDSIFIHGRLGAFIIEAKGTDRGWGVVKGIIKDSKKKLDKRIPGMKIIYQAIAGHELPFNIDFKGIICIANATFIWNEDTFPYGVFSKSDIDSEAFEKYWREQNSQLPINDDLRSFVATIIGFRSAKFKSLPSNVLEIHRIIEQQGIHKTAFLMNAESILLNNEQLRAVERAEPHVIISGPPGTGKTVVMLLRALEAAKKNKAGSVLIFSYYTGSALAALFARFFAENADQTINRRPIIYEELPSERLIRSEDDIFCDEVTCQTESLLTEYLEKQTFTGTITIVVTGFLEPQNVASPATVETVISSFRRFFPNIHHVQLAQVVRGTNLIIRKWERIFTKEERDLERGHTVEGPPAEEIIARDHSHMFEIIEQRLNSLLNITEWPLDNIVLAPRHIAVVSSRLLLSQTEEEPIYDVIKRYLKSKNFRCESFEEQVKCPWREWIAVGQADDALSLDWPAVIYVKLDGIDDFSENLIVFSRCIAKLLIISVQQK